MSNTARSTVVDLAQNAERYLMYVFYIYLLFIVLAEVVRRFVLDFSSLWGAETARYSFIYLTYLGTSWAIYKRTHIRIDAIYDVVSDRIENYLYLLSDIVVFLFAVYVIRFSLPIIQTSIRFGSVTQALRVNRAFFQAAIPIGFALVVVRILQRTYHDIQDIRHGRPVYKGENIFMAQDEK